MNQGRCLASMPNDVFYRSGNMEWSHPVIEEEAIGGKNWNEH